MLVILKADTPMPPVVAAQGDYGAIFEQRLRAAGYAGAVQSFDVVAGEYPPQSAITSGTTILITGSKHNAWEDDPWILKLVEFTKETIGRARIVGICFGHQIVGRALGAGVGRAEGGWEISNSEFELTSQGRAVFAELEQRLAADGGRAPTILQMHRDEVHELPPNTQLLARAPKTAVQGFYRPGSLLCVQGHPEFDQQIVETIVSVRFEGDVRDDALRRARTPHDGAAINQAIARFIAGEL